MRLWGGEERYPVSTARHGAAALRFNYVFVLALMLARVGLSMCMSWEVGGWVALVCTWVKLCESSDGHLEALYRVRTVGPA